MKKQLKQLKEFHEAFNLGWGSEPVRIDEKTRNLRVSIMREELNEAIEAMESEKIENIAKEIADVLYVVYGTIGSYGLADKIEDVFDEVHRSNMTKIGPGGKPEYREDGKVLKGKNFKPADVRGILNISRSPNTSNLDKK